MSNNPYATPESTLEVSQESKPSFFVVAPIKFTLMIAMTWGFYYIYWSYKNWKLYKMSTGTNISPYIRAYFNIFFVYSLFQRINQNIEKTGRSIAWSPKSRGGCPDRIAVAWNCSKPVCLFRAKHGFIFGFSQYQYILAHRCPAGNQLLRE